MIAMIITSIIVLLGVGVLIWKMENEAPEGYEDHDGFHYGHEA